MFKEYAIAILSTPNPNDAEAVQFHQEAIEWLLSDDPEPVGFRFVCENLDLPYDRVRKVLLSANGDRERVLEALKALKL